MVNFIIGTGLLFLGAFISLFRPGVSQGLGDSAARGLMDEGIAYAITMDILATGGPVAILAPVSFWLIIPNLDAAKKQGSILGSR